MKKDSEFSRSTAHSYEGVKPPFVVFDLDGTISLDHHRKHLAEAGEWDAYFDACDRDQPNAPVIATINTFCLYGCMDTVILTGRSDAVRDKTADWLKRHRVEYDQLIMRPHGNHTPDFALKPIMLEQQGIELSQVMAVYEDRQKVVDMWRANGVPCFQVAPGDF